MAARRTRLVILALLLAASAIAGQMLRVIEHRSDDLSTAQVDVTARLTRIGAALTGIGAAQHSYLAPGQADNPWFEQMTGLVRQFYDDTAAVGQQLRSPQSPVLLRSLSESSEALMAADTRARENLRLGLDLMAADLIFSEARALLERMTATLGQIQADENAVYRTERATLAAERWTILGIIAGVWLVMASILALIPARKEKEVDAAPVAEPTMAAPPAITTPAVDLATAADVCVALSRVTSAAALPALLSRAANVLHASGIILWMGSNNELFAVSAHGYPPQVIARIGPIARNAPNATAAAWRDGRLTVVAAAADASGAIVAPLLGPDACVGVLSVELRRGHDADPDLQSLATMIASQLASAVGAWPGAAPAPAR